MRRARSRGSARAAAARLRARRGASCAAQQQRRRAGSSRRRAGPAAGPAPCTGLMSCFSSRSMRQRADGDRDAERDPAQRLRSRSARGEVLRAGRRLRLRPRRARRMASTSLVLVRACGMPTRVGRDLGLAAVEEQPGVGLDRRRTPPSAPRRRTAARTARRGWSRTSSAPRSWRSSRPRSSRPSSTTSSGTPLGMKMPK